MEKKKYLEMLNEINWEKRKEIESLLIPAIKISKKEIKSENKIGVSKFGGKPDLPVNINWPILNEKPLCFLAQINLEEIMEFDIEKKLPETGILYFFVEHPGEFSLNHKIIYSNEKELLRNEYPKELDKNCQFSESKMNFEHIYTFPSNETLEIESLSEVDKDSYFEIDEDVFNYNNNQILGHTCPVQGDVNLEWAFTKLGIEFTEDNYENNKIEINNIRSKFINLLQFSTENSIPEFWEVFYIDSSGYFGITEKDLKELNFNETVLTFQNT